ncbi:MAG: alpha/beta hydrolase [Burkholderiaceae bacterium]
MVISLPDRSREITPEFFKRNYAHFAPHALRPTPQNCTVTRDLPYGPDDKQRLDIFQPVRSETHPLNNKSTVPTIVFVHGGGFKYGDKGSPDSPFYNNIGAWAASNGMLGVTMSYRLAPAFQWPSGSLDVAAAMDWLSENIGRFGGSAKSIVLFGQSAGAVHVAGYVARPSLRGPGPIAAGAVIMSGIYDLTRFPRNPFEDAYYGTDTSVMSECSTLDGLVEPDITCLFAIAELDSAAFQAQAAYLVSACVKKTKRWPNIVYANGHNHLSTVYSLGCPEHRLGEQIIEFAELVCQKTSA